MPITMLETVFFACGHSHVYERPYHRKGARIGDMWSCPRCSNEKEHGKNRGLTEVIKVTARSK